MLEKVEYIKDIFKIGTYSFIMLQDIANELEKIEDFDDFREWLKVNINHLDTKYMSPFQKFIFLIRMYIKQYLEVNNKERISNGERYALGLAWKVEDVSRFVEEDGAEYKNFKTTNGADAFSSFDKSQLEKVGGLFAAVKLQKSISGTDALADRLKELSYNLIVTNIIEYKPQEKLNKDVTMLLDGAVKKYRF